jgi:soluble P-type ATPase
MRIPHKQPQGLEIDIPGGEKLQLESLVLDYNGTLACDGVLLNGVRERLETLSGKLKIYVLTADTFGKAQSGLRGLPCELVILPASHQDIGKLDFIKPLGTDRTVCIGNGYNDRLMIQEAALGIVVVQAEGAAMKTVLAADVVCPNILAALDLLISPLRLVATLRS